MGNRKTAAQRNPAPAAKAAKPGDDVTADYFAQSNTAIDGIHFAYGDPIIGVTDRDQIELALRIGAIGRNPPGAAAPTADTAAQIDAALTAAGAADATAAKHLLANVASAFVELGARMGEGSTVLLDLTKAAFDQADAVASTLEDALVAVAEDASDEAKAAASAAADEAKAAREMADSAFAAFEDAEDFAAEFGKFDAALKAAVAELGK